MKNLARPAAVVAIAAAVAGPATPETAVAQEEPLTMEVCTTDALTREEAAAGATSVVVCEDLPLGEAFRVADVTLARVFNGLNGTGENFAVTDPDCTGAVVVFSSSDWWNNRISSTDLIACGNAKHWTGASFNGSNQLVSGGGYINMNATLDNMTSSIEYAP